MKNTVKNKEKTRFIEKYVQITYLIKHFYPEYIENFQNTRKQIVHFLNEQYLMPLQKGRYIDVNKHIKRCSTSLVMKEMKINIKMRYHYAYIRMPKI